MKRLMTLLAIALVSLSFAQAQIPTNGLVAYYPFNGNANDESGNGNNGTPWNVTVTTDRFRNAEKAYYFDGQSSYISVPNSPQLLPDVGSFSFCGWFNVHAMDVTKQDFYFLALGTAVGPYSGYSIFYNIPETSLVVQYHGYKVTDQTYLKVGFSEPLDTWHFFAAVLDRETTRATLYLDGTLADSQPIGPQLINTTIEDLFFGRRSQIPPYEALLNGSLDDIRIYNRALTESEVEALYDEVPPGPTITLLSPNGGEVWPFGSTQTIRWTSSGVSNVKIELSTDNGPSWLLVKDSIAAPTDSITWLVPNVPSTECLVRITDSGSGTTDTSDAVFAIVAGSSEHIIDAMGQAYEYKLSHMVTLESVQKLGAFPKMEQEYYMGRKHIGIVVVSYSHYGIALLIDLDDFLEITAEGKQGWVTCWVNLEANAGVSYPPIFHFGLTSFSFDASLPDPPRNIVLEGPSANVPFLSIRTFEVADGRVQLPETFSSMEEVTSEVELGLGKLSWCPMRFEFNKHAIAEIVDQSAGLSGFTGRITQVDNDKLQGSFLSFDKLGYPQRTTDPSLYREFTPGDDGSVVSGLIEFARGGLDENGDQVPDNSFPVHYLPRPPLRPYLTVEMELFVGFRTSSTVQGNYVVKASSDSYGWGIRPGRGDTHFSIFTEDREYSLDDVGPRQSVRSIWWVRYAILPDETPSEGSFRFILFENKLISDVPLDTVDVIVKPSIAKTYGVVVRCPVDIQVVTPVGDTINAETRVLNSSYVLADVDSNGSEDAVITVAYPPAGAYEIAVIPKSEAAPTDTFTLISGMGNNYVIHADGVQIQDIPTTPYVYNLTDVTNGVPILPVAYMLMCNYPNPFNPTTTIRYGLPERSHVLLTLFNTLGQEVATLVQGEREVGYHEVLFDASGLSSGVYFYRLIAGSYIQTRKLLLLR